MGGSLNLILQKRKWKIYSVFINCNVQKREDLVTGHNSLFDRWTGENRLNPYMIYKAVVVPDWRYISPALLYRPLKTQCRKF